MIYMFDIDGTLTEPRQKMSEQFEKMFSKWMKKKKVFLVTGSDIAKVREQVPQHILDKCSGVFTCMGNELYLDNKLALSADIQIPGQLKGWLEQQVEFSDCPTKTSNHLEWRTGMLNFSVVGRAATNEQRKEYCRWDKISGERNRIANFINNKYPELEACIGGEISIDIQGRGKNKSQAYKWVKEKYDEPVYFFGDKCKDGGNDSAIAKEIDKPHSNDYYMNVDGPHQLIDFLLEMEEECLDI